MPKIQPSDDCQTLTQVVEPTISPVKGEAFFPNPFLANSKEMEFHDSQDSIDSISDSPNEDKTGKS